MALNLFCLDGEKKMEIGQLATIRKEPIPKRERETKSVYCSTDSVSMLMHYLDLSREDAVKICEKYGYYAGAVKYLLKELGMTHEEAYEKGILWYPKPVYQCDDEHKAILEEYWRICMEKGIKAANNYFLSL